MRRHLLFAFLLGILLFWGTGCADARIHLTLNWNKSVDLDATITMKDSLRSLLAERDPMTEIKDTARSKGYTVTDYKNGDTSGIRLQKHLPSLADFDNFLIHKQTASPTVSSVPNAAPSSSKLALQRHLFVTKLIYQTNLDFSGSKDDSTDLPDVPQRLLASTVQCRLILTLPMKADSSNAGIVSADGKTLEWDLKAGQANPIQVAVTLPNYVNILFAVILVILIVIASVMRFSKRNPTTFGEPS